MNFFRKGLQAKLDPASTYLRIHAGRLQRPWTKAMHIKQKREIAPSK